MSHHPPSDASVPADPVPETLRRRLLVVLATQFALLMGVAAVQGFWPNAGPGAGVAILFLVISMAVVPIVMAAQSRPLLHDIGWLVAENARLRELYGRARQDSLVDGSPSWATTVPSRRSWPASWTSRCAPERGCRCS